jgi:hypothetical protein
LCHHPADVVVVVVVVAISDLWVAFNKPSEAIVDVVRVSDG